MPLLNIPNTLGSRSAISLPLFFLHPSGKKFAKFAWRLPIPVAFGVWMNGLPFQAADMLGFGNGCKFLLAIQVISDVVIMDFCWPLMLRVFDQQGDGDWRAIALAKNFPAFPAGYFTFCALIATQVVDVQMRKFFCQA